MKSLRIEPKSTPFTPSEFTKDFQRTRSQVLLGDNFSDQHYPLERTIEQFAEQDRKLNSSKLSITVEEADEVIFWVKILRESAILDDENIQNFEK